MVSKIDPQLEADLRLSHAFLNTLSAAYRGLWVFESTLAQLDGLDDREDELNKTERVLETLADWWREFDRHRPLFVVDERPVLDGDASRAWRLLQVAESRYRSLIGELTGSSDTRTLLQDDIGRNMRVAAYLEIAHFQRETVLGLIRRAEVIDQPRERSQWQQRVLACSQRIDEAEALVEQLSDAGDAPSERLMEQLLDATLLLPAHVAQRVIDVCQVFSLYTGVFEYEDAGIPEAQQSIWEQAGFQPPVAGRWFAAGLTPRKAIDWIAAGAQDPLVAAGFMWRGFTPEQAAPWLERFIEGKRAAEWIAAGCDAEDAREWIALGIRRPDEVGHGAAARRM
jgi:hypothetical protein